MASIWDFLDGQRGQDRTRALNEFLGSNFDYLLGPTGIPDKVRSLNALLNPIDQASQAGADTVMAMDPNRSDEERKRAAMNALVGTIGAAAPALVAGRAGIPAVNAIAETLTGVGGSIRNATDGIADAIPSEALYAGRSLAEGNMRGVLDVFTPGRPAQGLGADAVANIDDQVAAARKAVLDNPNDVALFDDYKRIRRMRDDGATPLPQTEAPTPQAGSGLLSDYVGQHRAPTRDGGAPAFNLAGDIYPDDIYSSKAVQYYGTGSDAMDKKTMSLLQSLRGSPDADVTIYRAVPKGVDNLNAGDWVTVSKQYAKDHGESALGGDFDIIEKKVKAGEIFTNGDSIHEFGYDPAPALPAPRSAAEAAAKDVLDLRADGRASEVTDEMMAAADDQYMYFNTPLPMDEASRMARAEAAGRDRAMYHGGKGGYTEFNPDMADGKGYDAGTWLSDDADIAATYAGGVFDNASTYPVVTDTKNFGSVDWRGGSWGDGDPYAYIRNPRGSDNFSDKLSTIYEDWKSWPSSDNAARAANYAGMSGVELKNIVDVGPNIFSRANSGKPLPEVSTSFAVFDPSVTRSRYARFDPEFAHLRNLSAGVGGLGLLSTMMPQEEQY